LKLKIFVFSSNQVELTVFTLHISTNKLLVQSLVCTYEDNFNLTFLFSIFRYNIENIDTAAFKNECSKFKSNVLPNLPRLERMQNTFSYNFYM